MRGLVIATRPKQHLARVKPYRDQSRVPNLVFATIETVLNVTTRIVAGDAEAIGTPPLPHL